MALKHNPGKPTAERLAHRAPEAARLAVLLAAALWLVHPYLEPRLIGTSDALWYHHVLADTVTQFRAGVFPVLVGQSEFSFNGSIYPIRVAPYHQYLAGIIDLLTGRTLGFFALQHLTMILSVLGGAVSAYCTLVWLAPQRRGSALVLALLYVMCPGVMGLFYAQDLYMSGMTLPWLPLAFGALLKTFDERRGAPLRIVAVSFAALWWAHAPIAFWSSAIGALALLAWLAVHRPASGAAGALLAAAAIFCALAIYPVASVFLLRSPGEAIVPYLMDRELLLRWVSDSFPSSIRPLDLSAPVISIMQFGYALWAALLAAVVAWTWRPRVAAVGVLLGASAILLILVFPVPIVTRALWLRIPETIVGMTLYWPMQRFYAIAAAITVVCLQRQLAEWRPLAAPLRLAAGCALLAALAWSASEASKLVRKASVAGDTVEESRRWSLPENVAIQRHSYGLFPGRPSYFSHGVLAPQMQSRLLDPATGAVVASDLDSPPGTVPWVDLRGTVDANPGILDLGPSLVLMPGVRYLLTIEFARPDAAGLLQLIGASLYREYLLPSSGDSKSFGSGPGNQHSISVWTSGHREETVALRFIPTEHGARPRDFIPFARYRLQPVDEGALPIRTYSLIPYRAEVRSPRPALLETPRMFIPGYAASVDGAPVAVRKSAEGLVEFSVPQGASQVELRYPGPFLLRAAFWLNASAWLCVAIRLAGMAARREPEPGSG
jgi:hypothetical protein